MPVLTSTSIKSSYGRLSYLFDQPAHDGSDQRVLAAGGQNIRMLHDPKTGEITNDQSGAYLQRQFHDSLRRAANPNRKQQAQSVILSFADGELTGTLEQRTQQALLIAKGFVAETQPEQSQWAFAVQCDGKGHMVHVHMLGNAVDREGKTIQTNNFSVYHLRKQVNEFMAEHSAEITGQEWVNPIKAADHVRQDLPNKSDWKNALKATIDDAKADATSVSDFKKKLGAVGVTITERGKAKEWTYHLTVNGKEQKARGFHQQIDKKTGEIKASSGLGRNYGRDAILHFIADLNREEPKELTEIERLEAKRSAMAASVKMPTSTAADPVAAVEAAMRKNVAKTEQNMKGEPTMDDFHFDLDASDLDAEIDEDAATSQADATTSAARNRYANLMADDLKRTTPQSTAATPDPEPDMSEHVTMDDVAVSINNYGAKPKPDDDGEAARGLSLARKQHSLAERLVLGDADLNQSVLNDSAENNNFGFLSKDTSSWTRQDQEDFLQACHDAEKSETGGEPDPADVQNRARKARVALMMSDFGTSYAELFKQREDHDPEVIKQAQEAMDGYEKDGDMTVDQNDFDQTGTPKGSDGTSYSKLAVLARALKVVLQRRILNRERITLRTVVRTVTAENRVAKQEAQHKADVQLSEEKRIAAKLDKWKIAPVGSQTDKQLYDAFKRDAKYIQDTIKTRGITDRRGREQVRDEVTGVKYTANRSAWQNLQKGLDASVARGLGVAPSDDLGR